MMALLRRGTLDVVFFIWILHLDSSFVSRKVIIPDKNCEIDKTKYSMKMKIFTHEGLMKNVREISDCL